MPVAILSAARSLRRSPGFTAAAVATLALGLGPAIAMFSLVWATLLKPFPFPTADRIVMPVVRLADGDYDVIPSGVATTEALSATSFEAAALIDYGYDVLVGAGDPAGIIGTAVERDFFRVFGTEPAIGRLFTAIERDTAVIGWRLWHERLGGAPDIVGRVIEFGGRPYTIVGVMPAGFDEPSSTLLWTPLNPRPTPAEMADNYVDAIALLRQDVTLDQARAEIAVIGHRLAEGSPDAQGLARLDLEVLRNFAVGFLDRPLALLFAASVFVVLIACANVANLLLARGIGRSRDIALRISLGASRAGIVRQILAESLVIALAGAAAGLLLAQWLIPAAVAYLPPVVSRVASAGIDVVVAGFAVVLAVGTAVVSGLLPAIRQSRPALAPLLGGVTMTMPTRQSRSMGSLVVLQVALGTTLLVGASLMLVTLQRLGAQADAVRTEGLRHLRLTLPSADRGRVLDELAATIAAVPGVRWASPVSRPPLAGGAMTRIEMGGAFPEPVPTVSIGAGYFARLGIPRLAGREFSDGDGPAAPWVAIVDELAAARIAADTGRPALGQSLTVTVGVPRPVEIVGVVGSVPFSLTEPARPMVYLSVRQHAASGAFGVLIDSPLEAVALVRQVRAAVRQVDPRLPVDDPIPLDAVLGRQLSSQRLRALVFGVAAASAVSIAALGIFSVLAYVVTRRRREVAVRIALGAGQRDIAALVLVGAIRQVVLGLAAGLVLAAALSSIVRAMVHGVSATDPLTYVTAAALFLLVSLAAAWLPLRRALRSDPARLLRTE
ncbi:MAG: ABC transporter permease [Acidobacteria bacterium]|nr:ABC transporter permease [Acidobacteriota bacterium]